MSKSPKSENKVIFSALFWKFMERMGATGIQFVLQIILARLLDPEHYGAVSLMVVFTTLANVFIQRGFNTSLIQNKDVTEEDYSSVLWVTLGIAGVIYGILFFASPLIARFYNMPEIVTPFRVLALMLFPGAVNSIQRAKVNRDMNFKNVFYSNLAGIIIGGTIGVIIACMGGGIWALVVQDLLYAVVVCVVMFFTVRLRIRFVCNMARVKVLFSYGWKLLVSGLLDTLYQDIRSLVVGKKFDSGALGYYNRGAQFPQYINKVVNSTVQSVMLPAMSAKQDEPERVKSLMRNSVTLSAYIIFPMMAGLAAVAEPLVELILTDKWLPCVPYLQIYCFTLAFHPVHSCNLQAINAMGRSDLFLKLEIIKKAYGLAALVIATVFFDSPIAIAMTGAISTVISCFVNAAPNKKLINYSYLSQVRDICPSFLASIGMLAIVRLLHRLELAALPALLLQILVGIFAYVAISAIFRLKPYKMVLNMAVKMIKKRKTSE